MQTQTPGEGGGSGAVVAVGLLTLLLIPILPIRALSMRFTLPRHVEEFPERLAECDHCGGDMKVRLLEKHSAACDMRPAPCPNHCGAPVMPLGRHRAECPLELFCCPYSAVGCEVTRLRKDMAGHQGGVAVHFPTLMATVVEQKRPLALYAVAMTGPAACTYVSLLNQC